MLGIGHEANLHPLQIPWLSEDAGRNTALGELGRRLPFEYIGSEEAQPIRPVM
jgi:hypothetical protein